jgi:hypothetical protein
MPNLTRCNYITYKSPAGKLINNGVTFFYGHIISLQGFSTIRIRHSGGLERFESPASSSNPARAAPEFRHPRGTDASTFVPGSQRGSGAELHRLIRSRENRT